MLVPKMTSSTSAVLRSLRVADRAQHGGRQLLGVDARKGTLAHLADSTGSAAHVDDPGFGRKAPSGLLGGAPFLADCRAAHRSGRTGVSCTTSLDHGPVPVGWHARHDGRHDRSFHGHHGLRIAATAIGDPGDPAVLLAHGGGQATFVAHHDPPPRHSRLVRGVGMDLAVTETASGHPMATTRCRRSPPTWPRSPTTRSSRADRCIARRHRIARRVGCDGR